MKTGTRRAALFAASVVVAAGSAAIATAVLPDHSVSQSSAGSDGSAATIVGGGADRLPNTTAADWVTNSDYVVKVRPVSEKEVPPTTTEVERGEGLINRRLTLDVQDVLWSRPDAPVSAPKSITWQAVGWQFFNGDTDDRVEMAIEDAPRLEVGHTYLLAVVWNGGSCGSGSDQHDKQAGWSGLGADSVVPFDSGVIGDGELQGAVQSATKSAGAVTSATKDAPLEETLAGKGAGQLTSALNAARPTQQRTAVVERLCQ